MHSKMILSGNGMYGNGKSKNEIYNAGTEALKCITQNGYNTIVLGPWTNPVFKAFIRNEKEFNKKLKVCFASNSVEKYADGFCGKISDDEIYEKVSLDDLGDSHIYITTADLMEFPINAMIRGLKRNPGGTDELSLKDDNEYTEQFKTIVVARGGQFGMRNYLHGKDSTIAVEIGKDRANKINKEIKKRFRLKTEPNLRVHNGDIFINSEGNYISDVPVSHMNYHTSEIMKFNDIALGIDGVVATGIVPGEHVDAFYTGIGNHVQLMKELV